MPDSSAKRSGQFALALTLVTVFVFALLPRLWVAIEHPSSIGDGSTYTLVADNVRLNGCVSLSPVEEAACVPHAGGNQPPGYPFLVAAIHALVGPSDHSVPIVQAVLSALAIAYAVWRLSTCLTARQAMLVGIVLAFSFVSIAWARLVFTESVSIVLSIVVLVEALNVRVRTSRLAVYLLGFYLGAAVFLRYDAIFLAAPVGVLLFWAGRHRPPLRDILVIGVIALLPLTIWGARNVTRGLAPISIEYVPANGWSPPKGYIAWVGTWVVDQFDYPQVMFPISGGSYQAITIPDAAFANFDDRANVDQLLAELRRHDGNEFPIRLDASFATLAAIRQQEMSLARRLHLYFGRAIHMWGSPFFSSGYPFRSDVATRVAARNGGGILGLALDNPLVTLIKGIGTVYRIALLVSAAALTLFAIRGRHSLLAAVLLAGLAFAVIRTGAFSVAGLTETRYLAPIFAWLEVGVAVGFATLLAERRARLTSRHDRA
jgi:hypothetical protein